MNRRAYLKGAAALLGGAGISGCADVPIGGEATDRPAPTDGPTLTDEAFDVSRRECGNEVEEAAVEVGDGRVAITGTLTGSDACKTATVEDASYDAETDSFRVLVAAIDAENADACAQCLTEIDYEATYTFDGGTPGRVVVEHETRGETRVAADTGADSS